MNVVIQIQGRNAIPVRAIPLMTYQVALTTTELADIFSNGKAGVCQGLTAFRLVGDKVLPISPNFWIDVSVALQSLSDTMQAKQCPYREWQHQALEELPASTFVWKDELEQYVAQLNDEGGDSDEYLVNLAPVTVELDCSPLVSSKLELVAMQGFPFADLSDLPAAPNATEVGGTAPAQNLVALEPASDGPEKSKRTNRRTWRDVSEAYLEHTFKELQRPTVKSFFAALKRKAGADSPFDIGIGQNYGSLFSRDAGVVVSIKMIERFVTELRKKM